MYINLLKIGYLVDTYDKKSEKNCVNDQYAELLFLKQHAGKCSCIH